MCGFRGIGLVVGGLALSASACGDGGNMTGDADAGRESDAMVLPDAQVQPDAMLDELAIEVDPSSVNLNEGGGTATFAVTLNRSPGGSFDVAVASADESVVSASPAALTFNASNFDTPQTVTLTPQDDDDTGDELTTIDLSGTGAGSAQVDVTVADDDEQAIVSSTSSVAVQEEGTNTFTVELAAEPSAAVDVSLTSGDTAAASVAPSSLTFTASTWDVPQTVTVTGEADADTENETTDVTLGSAVLTDVTVGVTVTDNDVQNIFPDPDTVALDEGGADGTFDVSLTQQPSSDVQVSVGSSDGGAVAADPATLTFTPSNFSTPQTVTLSPQDDGDALDEAPTVTLSASGIPDATVSVAVADDEVQTHVVSPTDLTVTEEGSTATFTVNLSADPVTDVTVDITSQDPGAVSATPSTITFTSANFSDPQTVTVAGLSDPDLVDEDVNVTVASPVAPTESVAVTVQEDDLQDLVVSTNTLTVTEDTDPDTFTVRLAFQPSGTVGVDIATSDAGSATAAPAELLFTTTNYDVPQAVTVSGTSDLNLHDTSATVTASSPGLQDENVDVTVLDDDEQDILVQPSVTVAETDSVDLDVSLAFEPFCDQASPGCAETVTFTSDDAGAADVAPTTLSFTASDYDVAQTLTITAPSDDDIRDESVTIDADSDEGTTTDETIAVTVTDPDTQAYVFGTVDTPILEGDGGAIEVNLEHDPVDDFTVSVTSADPATLAVDDGDGAPVELTFTSGNYETPQTISTAAVEDDDLRDEDIDVTFSGNDPAQGTVSAVQTITANDNDEQEILADTSLLVVEEAEAELPVVLAHEPDGDRIVHVNESSGDFDVDKASLTFTQANWDVPQTVTVSGLADDDLDDESGTITLTTAPEVDPALREGASHSVAVSVDDNDVQRILVTTEPETLAPSLQEGGPTIRFGVNLEFPPRSVGGDDVVEVTVPSAEDLRIDDGTATGATSTTLTFDASNFDDLQFVTLLALDDFEDQQSFDRSQEVDDLVTVNLTIQGEAQEQQNNSSGPDFEDETLDVRIVDDEIESIENVVQTGFTGATRHTERQNINWALDTLAASAYDAGSSGETVLATLPRDDLTALTASGAFADSSGVSAPVESVEFDGDNLGVFASDTNGIVFTSLSRGLSEIVAPMTVTGSDGVDFWTAFNGTDYGLLYRDATDDNLRFRLISPDGTNVSGEVIVTTATASAHQHPNLHPTSSGGWVALYTTATDVRCVSLASDGVPFSGSDVSLTDQQGGPPGGAFVSSIIDPDAASDTIVATYIDPSGGLSIAEIDGSACSVVSSTSGLALSPGTFVNTPFIAFNDEAFDAGVLGAPGEYAIAFDLADGTMGVTLLDNTREFRDVINLGQGNRPSVVWAGDRWVVRALDGASDGTGELYLESGSFQTHCSDGELNADETGVDCGGADCQACIAL